MIPKDTAMSDAVQGAPAESVVLTRDDLIDALENHRFVLYFQPQYNYALGQICGAEALVRLKHPRYGMLSPDRFISRAEDVHLINMVDREVWDKTLGLMRAWLDAGIRIPPISLNISRYSLLVENLIDDIDYLMNLHQIRPDMIHIEITESAYAADNMTIQNVINSLHERGFHMEMDDFGSGYSSLSLLKDTFVDTIKLDGAFLLIGKNHKRGSSIISSIVRMAYDLNMRVVAEGVEHKYQAEFLKSIGCFVMQGYYFSRPISESVFLEMLQLDGVSTEPGNIQVPEVGHALDFLDDTTQSALLFNSFVGGAYIFEYRGDTTTILRANEKFFTELGVRYDDFRVRGNYSLIRLLRDESRTRIMDILDSAIESGEEKCCTVCSETLHPGNETWMFFRLRCLANKLSSYIFYASVENITEEILLIRRNNALSGELNAIISNIPGGLARYRFVDGKMICEFMSKGFHEMRGYPEHELMEILNTTTFGHVHPEDAENLRAVVQNSRINHTNIRESFRVRHKDGQYIWVDMNAIYREDPDGGLLYCYIRDITQAKLLQRKYANTLRDVANLSNSIGGGTALYEIKAGRLELLYVSAGTAAMSGRTPEQFRADFEVDKTKGIYEPDAKQLEYTLDRLIRGEQREMDQNFRALSKDGNLFWVNIHGRVTTDEDGRTLLNTAYRNLSSTTALYYDIINEADTGVVVSRRDDYGILYINDAAARIGNIDPGCRNTGFCYSGIYKKDAPCADCERTLTAEGTVQQKIFNGRSYKVVRKPIIWNGIDAFVSYMYDKTPEE